MGRRGQLRHPVVVYLALALASVGLPLVTRDSYYLDVATNILMNLVLTMSLQLEMSTGQVNMAHISFMGIGAYASALVVMKLGYSFWTALWIAGVLTAAVAVPVGGMALRLTGPYYFLITFAFSEVVRLIFNNFFVGTFGGTSGLVDIPKPDPMLWFGHRLFFAGKLELYLLMVALFLPVAAILVRLEYSRFGLISNAIRQRDQLAETLGIDVLRHRLAALVIGSFMAGLAGAFFAHSHQVLHSNDFSLEPMVLLMVFTVIGGVGSVWGAVAGTVVLAIVTELMRELRYYQTLVLGAVLILTMLMIPEGLISLPARVGRGLRWRRLGNEAEAMRIDVAS